MRLFLEIFYAVDVDLKRNVYKIHHSTFVTVNMSCQDFEKSKLVYLNF